MHAKEVRLGLGSGEPDAAEPLAARAERSKRRADDHAGLKRKYGRAASSPWRSVAPDGPVPDWP